MLTPRLQPCGGPKYNEEPQPAPKQGHPHSNLAWSSSTLQQKRRSGQDGPSLELGQHPPLKAGCDPSLCLCNNAEVATYMH